MTKFMERVFVWSGGGLFVGSLGFCAYTYLVRWSDAAPRGGWSAWLGNSGLIGVFAAHHSLFARESVKRWLARRIPERLLRSVYVWLASSLLIAACALWSPIGGELYDAVGWGAAPLGAVELLGIWFIARAVATIDPLDLAGIRQIRFRRASRITGHEKSSARWPADANSQAGPPDRLQVVGPYRFVRHPVYFGWVLVVFGTPHLTGDRLAFAALTTMYLVVAIRWEERSLTAEFGQDYDQYKKAVPWRLVPYVY